MKRIFMLLMMFILSVLVIGCNAKKYLDKETEKYIKECYINYMKSRTPYFSKNVDEIVIKRYFGDFDGVKIAIIEGNEENSIIYPQQFYLCKVDGVFYSIKYLPEMISVYYENNYYTLPDACEKGLITKKILDQLDCYY